MPGSLLLLHRVIILANDVVLAEHVAEGMLVIKLVSYRLRDLVRQVFDPFQVVAP
jgi:hypothetical protein